MIHLSAVEVLHWDIQAHQKLHLAGGVTLLTGENGSGKTSVLDAIKVAFGARALDGGRSVSSYLARQSKSPAMIRLLVDNRPAPGSRRRPFDVLGGYGSDVVTLAVVFEARDEDGWQSSYYMLDGDVVPLTADGQPAGGAPGRRRRRGAGPTEDGPRPLPSATAYRERLKRVGVGPSYLNLLAQPQGQIASLCRFDGERLFQVLFDVIGGRDALEAWEERMRELHQRRKEQKQVEETLEASKRDLHHLEARVRRFVQYRTLLAEERAFREALPYLKLRELETRSSDLAGEARRLRHERDRAEASLSECERNATALGLAISDAVAADNLLAEQAKDADNRWRSVVEETAAHRARREGLDALREAVRSVVPRDTTEIQHEFEALRATLAAGQAGAHDRLARAAAITLELADLERGQLKWPDEVAAFREALYAAGIPHHLLAELLEMRDEDWTDALEGFLGRHRYAIVLQEADAFDAAADLARHHRYAPGVLAPDVRGRSVADEDSPATLVHVKDARYRSLVARLLRPLRPQEPERPYDPPRGEAYLAADGFVLERLEARFAPAGDLVLGLEARRRRKEQLTFEQANLAAEGRTWAARERELRASIQRSDEELQLQNKRLQWLDAADEHRELVGKVERLQEMQRRIEAEKERLEAERRALSGRLAVHRREQTEAVERATRYRAELVMLHDDIQALDPKRAEADAELGQARVTPLEAPDAEVAAVLAEHGSATAVQATLAEKQRTLQQFSADERDALLPENAARQRQEVSAVSRQLEQLANDLAQTQQAAADARDHYHQTTRLVFRGYFARLRQAAKELDFDIQGQLESIADGRFSCVIRVGVGDKGHVHHDSEELSGGQKAALSILMAMTAVSLEDSGAGFFLIDEPFSASDLGKINELGSFLGRTGAQYLLSMPTSSDLSRCGPWLEAVWTCTRSRGGHDENGDLRLAPPVKQSFAEGARAGDAAQ